MNNQQRLKASANDLIAENADSGKADDLRPSSTISPAAGSETATSARAASDRFVNEHSLCAMCDSELEISHEINRTELKVKEQAHCPSCEIRVRTSHHLMH